jgi:hypothetical protein
MKTLRLSHKKWKMWIQKICQSSVSFLFILKTSSNEKFISGVHWNVLNIYFECLIVLNDVIVVDFYFG